MTAKKAVPQKTPKKKAAKKIRLPKTWNLELLSTGTNPPRLEEIKHRDKIRIFGDKKKCYVVTVSVQEKDCKMGVGGGPIIIHS